MMKEPDPTAMDIYDRAFARLSEQGTPPEIAMLAVVDDYLDGKPRPRNKKQRLTKTERDQAFWSSRLADAIPAKL